MRDDFYNIGLEAEVNLTEFLRDHYVSQTFPKKGRKESERLLKKIVLSKKPKAKKTVKPVKGGVDTQQPTILSVEQTKMKGGIVKMCTTYATGVTISYTRRATNLSMKNSLT
jgi:hypothetical protein